MYTRELWGSAVVVCGFDDDGVFITKLSQEVFHYVNRRMLWSSLLWAPVLVVGIYVSLFPDNTHVNVAAYVKEIGRLNRTTT